jgi:uncharacterized protein
LCDRAGFDVIRSDVVRKELAGLPASEPSPAHLRSALYSAEATDRTDAECLCQAERLLAAGRRVIVDDTFREERRRERFLIAATRHGVPGAVIVCDALPETVRRRLGKRTGDVSDADWITHLRAAEGWEESGVDVQRVLHAGSTEGTVEDALGRALDVLRRIDLLEQ